MRAQSAKSKGRRLQQWLCKLLSHELEIPPEDCRSCSMGAGGEDVQLSASAREKFPYSVECKNREQHNIWGAYKQAEANAPRATEPILCIKRNKSAPLVLVDAEHFVALVKKATGKTAIHAADPPDDTQIRVFITEQCVLKA